MNIESSKELAYIKTTFLALRKVADQGLLLVEKLERKASSPRKRPKNSQSQKYTALILSGKRATKGDTIG